jgi:hypothetical protein
MTCKHGTLLTAYMQVEKRGTEAKRETENMKSEHRMRDVALRRLNRAEGECKAAQVGL